MIVVLKVVVVMVVSVRLERPWKEGRSENITKGESIGRRKVVWWVVVRCGEAWVPSECIFLLQVPGGGGDRRGGAGGGRGVDFQTFLQRSVYCHNTTT